MALGPSGSRTRAFLFADLRDYTAFVEQNGDAAAAELLSIYRRIVRDAIADLEGAEIRTEGDSFYVVFASAGDAVRCGLAIVARAADQCAEDPARPVRVGVGVHAGETAETTEGYVGSAVNIAARLCAQARAGEVLVSDTVRGLTRTSSDLAYEPRGRRRLKGVAEDVSVFSAIPSSVGARPRARTADGRVGRVLSVRAGAVAVAATGVVAVGALVALTTWSGLGATPSTIPSSAPAGAVSPSPSGEATPKPLPLGDDLAPHVTMPPGWYRTVHFSPVFDMQYGQGWEAVTDDADTVELHRQTTPRGLPDGVLTFAHPLLVYPGPCPTQDAIPLDPSPQGAIAWLRGRPDLTVGAPLPTTVGDAAGLAVDVTVPEKAPDCPDLPAGYPAGSYLFPLSRDALFLPPGELVRVMAFQVRGQTLLAILERTAATADAVDAEIRTLLPTISFP